MSNIPKSKQGKSQTKYFTFGLTVAKNIMCYICENFGLLELQHNVILFAKNNSMTDYDKADLERLARTYHISVENQHIYKMMDKFSSTIMDHCFSFLYNIVEANTVYPNSEYELNLRKEYGWKAISDMEYILCTLQLLMEMIPKEKDLKKIKVYIDQIKDEIRLLKNWKTSFNKLNKSARNNEATRQANIELEKNRIIQHEINKRILEARNTSQEAIYEEGLIESSKRICENLYNYNHGMYREFFNRQFYDPTTNQELDPPIVFFPPEIPTSWLPLYTYEHMHHMYNPMWELMKR